MAMDSLFVNPSFRFLVGNFHTSSVCPFYGCLRAYKEITKQAKIGKQAKFPQLNRLFHFFRLRCFRSAPLPSGRTKR